MLFTNKKNRVVVVTGADRGIGKATSDELIKSGASVILISKNKNPEESNIKIENIGNVLNISLDIRNADSVQKSIDHAVQKFGRIDALINVAGIAYYGGIELCTEQQWDETLDVNVKGYFLMAKAVFPHMKAAKHGIIINMSSVWGTRGTPTMLAYSASKFAVEGFTKCLQEESRSYGIKVTSLILDKVDTLFRDLMQEYVTFSHEQKARMLSVTDVVNTVMWILNSSPRLLPSSITLDAFSWK